jgi:hypothetical protein
MEGISGIPLEGARVGKVIDLPAVPLPLPRRKMEEAPAVIDDGRVGKIGAVPEHVANGTPEEQIEFLKRMTRNGVARGEAPWPGQEAAPLPRSERPLPAGVSDRVTSYDLPDGRRVWLRPLSLKAKIALGKHLSEDLRKARVFRKEVPAEQVDAYRVEYELESLYRGNLWAVVLAARAGPERDAPLAFEPADVPALLEAEDWAAPVEEMAALLDALTQAGNSELDVTREVITRFFERQQGWAETCSSRLAALLPPGFSSNLPSSERPPLSWEQETILQVKEALDDFAYSVSSLKPQTRRWGVGEVQRLAMVLGLPPAPAPLGLGAEPVEA